MYNKIVAYAAAIRSVDPSAKIAGFEEWSWWAMFFSGFDQANGAGAANSDYNTHGQMYYYPWLLQQLYKYKQNTGTSPLDILTVHCYNAIPDNGDDSLSGQQTRNRETRILWDPSFNDPSWYGDIGINGRVINWIPTMRTRVSQYYPGLQIGCTEYNWGDEANLNGATTQADVLGIYGREGFDLATRWTVAKNTNTSPTTYYPTYLASQIYRNYDGNHSTFGDTSVASTVANPDNLSAFAALRNSDGALTVMVINKQQGSTPVTVSLANFPSSGVAQAWQISSATQTSITHLADLTVSNNNISTTVPSQSITLFVIPSGSVLSPPAAPTGVAATVGNGSVTVTWNAGGGATSYTVGRAQVSGGPYTSVGTVTSPSPTTFTNTGLTNGTTYYYVVTGSNKAGTSPNSAEVAATPIVPPTFASSASASPNPVTQGASTTITATVKDTANTLTNGIVQVLAVDPNGNTAASQNFSAQSFTANQSRNYTLTFTPAVSGAFTIEVGVFSSTWQQWHWNSSAGSITVNSSLTFSSSATATPSTVGRGSSTTIAFTVTDTGTASLTNANIELQVFDASNNAVVTNVWSGQNFAGGQNHQYSYTWNVPASQATGTYTAMIGVFDSGWSTNYHWNSTGATITVTTAQAPPSADSVTPNGGAGTSQTFAFQFSSAAGYSDLAEVFGSINSTVNGAGGCRVEYQQSTNRLYLLNDAGTGWQGPITISAAGTLSNSQCTLNGAQSSRTLSGNTLTLRLTLSFTPAFAGLRNIYAEAINQSKLASGWKTLGIWDTAAPQAVPPAANSITPSAGAGTNQVFTYQFSSVNGYGYLSSVHGLVNSSMTNVNGCRWYYQRGQNRLYLFNDPATAWQGPLTPGVAGVVSNSQCTVDAGNSSVSGSGNTLTLKLSLSFTPSFAGLKNLYAYAQDNGSVNSGWKTVGTWNTAAPQAVAPTADSVTPNSGHGASQSFTFRFSSVNSYGYLATVFGLINSALQNTNACRVYYQRSTNRLYLFNDAATAWQGPLTPGVTGTTSNSQCTLDAGQSSVSGVGNTLAVQVALSFTPAFTGAKSIYGWATDNANLNSGWKTLGTWTAGP